MYFFPIIALLLNINTENVDTAKCNKEVRTFLLITLEKNNYLPKLPAKGSSEYAATDRTKIYVLTQSRATYRLS